MIYRTWCPGHGSCQQINEPQVASTESQDDAVAVCVHRVAAIEGATVEHNKFCVSVHFRNCQADQYDAVLAAVETTLRGHDELHATRGRKVFEIRPQVTCCMSV